MRKIRIITDSASDISPNFAKELDVSVVPTNVIINDVHYKDGVDIDSDAFFKMLKEQDVFPKTSQPSPEDFMNEFKKYSDYDDIICINITSQGSGTYNSACLAKKFLEEEHFEPNIYVVDSLNASVAVLEQVKIAKNMVDNGKMTDEILAKLEYIKDKMSIYFILDTLEYVRKGGRIGNAKAALGTLLNIKPVLTLARGVVHDVAKARGQDKGRAKLIEFFANKAESFEEVTIVHAFNLEQAKVLEAEILGKFKNIKTNICQVGISIGSYAGPGGIGLVFLEKSPKW